MVIVMEKHSSESHIEHVVAELTARGFDVGQRVVDEHDTGTVFDTKGFGGGRVERVVALLVTDRR